MLKYINLKKLTAKTLVGILMIGGLVTPAGTKKATATSFESCNNGHGNNAASTVYFTDSDGSEAYITVEKFDPSNEKNWSKNYNKNKKQQLVDALEDKDQGSPFIIDYSGYDGNGLNANLAQYVADNVQDLEKNCDSDNDGINDADEGEKDIDNDGLPNYMDTDSDGDGKLDSAEGTGDDDNDNIANYLDAVDDNVTSIDDSDSGSSPDSITLTGTIRDFKSSHPDFESTTGNDRGIVTTQLGADKKPVYANHPNDDTKTTNGKANFDQWYRDVDEVNLSKEHSITLTKQDDGTYKYQNNSFFPINNELFGNFKDGKNYHFTYELHTKFTYKGGEVFTFSGDDDVFVYINGQRVIDIGGVHTSQTESVSLDSLGLTVGETYDLDFFFAERHYSQSNFTITTSIELETAPDPNADDDNDGISNLQEGSEEGLDTDEDGIPDYEDDDSDNNLIPDSLEVGSSSASPTDSDGDGVPNFQDDDDDGNGIPDIKEIGYQLDGNGIPIPPSNGSVPIPTNTDGTDLPDYQDTDDDNDGILDVDEGVLEKDENGTFNYQNINSDADGDGILDKVELADDSDGDGVPDFKDWDSDNPNASTLSDVEDPNYIGLPDDVDSDPDNNDNDDDGILDDREIIADADENGEPDIDLNDLPNGGTIDDVDGDEIPNDEDLDSDNDGIPDAKENPGNGLNPYIFNYAD